MTLNISGFNPQIFFAANTAVQTTFFTIFTLPTFICCGVCLLALLFTKQINSKMRVLLLNIFGAEVFYLLGVTVLYLGYPIRAREIGVEFVSCLLVTGTLLVGFNANITATTLFAVMVYLFVKYGVKKLKWYIIVPFIAISWCIFVVLGLLASFNVFDYNPKTVNGFCLLDPTEASILSVISVIAQNIFLVIACSAVIPTFSILSYRYMRNHSVDENIAIKRAVSKLLLYLSIRMIIIVLQYLVYIPFIYFRLTTEGFDNVILYLSLEYLFSRVCIDIPSLLTPVLAISQCVMR